MSSRRIVIAGFGAAGLTTAEVLRQHGFDGSLTILSEEREDPYDRPTLSKHYLLGEFDAERIRLVSPERIRALGARILRGRRAVALDAAERTVTDSEGESHAFDDLVIATGVAPRVMPVTDGVPGVHTLRTRRDADLLRASLGADTRLLVIGGGVLGLEVAASARRLGSDVTVLERGNLPLATRFDRRICERLQDLHHGHGVRILTDARVAYIARGPEGRLAAAVLTDGNEVAADVALVAVGSSPELGWLRGSGLTLDDGIVCDERSQAAPGIWAAGDVARWLHVGTGSSMRLEHRMNATEHGRHVARNILGADEPYRPVPFFWTDHFDVRIQSAGFGVEGIEPEIVSGDWHAESLAIEYRHERELRAAVGWNAVKQLLPLRRELATQPRRVA